MAPLTKNQPAILLKALHRYTLSNFTASVEQFFADHLSMAPFVIQDPHLQNVFLISKVRHAQLLV